MLLHACTETQYVYGVKFGTVASLKFNMEGYITSSVCGKRAGLQVAETNYFLRLYATFD